MQEEVVEVPLPKVLILEDGEQVTLDDTSVHSLELACYVRDNTELVLSTLRSLGFRPAPGLPLGEIASLAKPLGRYLELHVRVFSEGLILAEVEVARRYLEHFLTGAVNGAYMLYLMLRESGLRKVHLVYRGRVVREVKEVTNYIIKVEPPLHDLRDVIREVTHGLTSHVVDSARLLLRALVHFLSFSNY